jgi:alpha-beta hydrolase superfamily lysophospholipase
MYIRALLVFLVGLSVYYRQLLDREHWLPESARLHSSSEGSESSSEGSFRNGWGLRIVWRRLTQSVVNCKGAVLFVHGYGEHSGYYADVANALHSALQLQGYALDHAGHGNSDGQRAYVYSVQQLAADVRSVAMRVKALHPDVPLLLYAHSMGGMVRDDKYHSE